MEVTPDEQVHPVVIAHVTIVLELDIFNDVVAAHAFMYRKFKPRFFGLSNHAGPGSCQSPFFLIVVVDSGELGTGTRCQFRIFMLRIFVARTSGQRESAFLSFQFGRIIRE